jgi:hypothetical protein
LFVASFTRADVWDKPQRADSAKHEALGKDERKIEHASFYSPHHHSLLT